jgi:sialate O-acetylesterase
MEKRIRRTSRLFRTSSLALLSLIGFLAGSGHSDVAPNALFGDHAVLQQGISIPIWGKADPGEAVKVTFGEETQQTTADIKGHWSVTFEARTAGGPHELSLEGKNKVELSNVMVGEVWVCSGQSNMAWTVRRANRSNTEIAAAQWPNIRLFTVKRNVSGEPLDTVVGSWKACSSETVVNFSAVAYYFGRDIHQMVEVPVGLIHTSWGGTPSDAWTSQEALASTGDLYKKRFASWKKALEVFPEKQAKYLEKRKAYQAARAYVNDFDNEVRVLDERFGDPRVRDLKIASVIPRPSGPRGPNNAHRPAGLYNAMIHPLVPYAIRGAIWYQGEANAGRAHQYRTLFPLMISDWRQAWGQGDFPFYWVQLANYMERKDDPGSSAWAELREAQSMTLKLPNTGQAVIIDIGETDDIHPRNKQDVGRRLARIALARDYGREMTYSGPTYKSLRVKDGKARLAFDHAEPGLVAPRGTVRGFAIAGKDSQFVWANAEIDGSEVVVWSEDVKKPIAVRYGWSDNPVCNLYNKVGLPASPFRTDDWAGGTVGRN